MSAAFRNFRRSSVSLRLSSSMSSSSTSSLLLSLVHYMFCNIFCKFIFTVIADDPIEIHLAVVIDNIPCRETLSVIHAHIKRRIGVPVGKSPLRCVKLER